MKERLIRILTVDYRVYDEIKQDEKATSQAAIMVIVAAILSAIGGGFLSSNIPTGFISLLAWGIVSWLLWAMVIYFVGTKIFHGKATMSQLLRVLGFAYLPAAFNILSFIPLMGFLIHFLVAFYLLISFYVATRTTLDLEGGQAFTTVIIGWFIYLIGLGVVLTLVGALEGIIG